VARGSWGPRLLNTGVAARVRLRYKRSLPADGPADPTFLDQGLMMKTIALASTLLGITLAVGCKSNNNDLAQVPPAPTYPSDRGVFDPASAAPVPAADDYVPPPAPADDPGMVAPPAPAPAPPAPAAAPPVAAGQEYTVKKGDTLWDLSKKFYGKGTEWKRIANANPQIQDPKKLRAGTVIVIPGADAPIGGGTAGVGGSGDGFEKGMGGSRDVGDEQFK